MLNLDPRSAVTQSENEVHESMNNIYHIALHSSLACKCQELDRQHNIQSSSQAEYSIRCCCLFFKLNQKCPSDKLTVQAKIVRNAPDSGAKPG